uniref:Beta-1,4-mannosyltransferase egh n=1 Tax=Hemiscolopendra marginata TaxID=943146 RepID=A0A646QCK4_9MYRI
MEICENRRVYRSQRPEKLKTTSYAFLLSLIHKFHIPHLMHCCILLIGFILFDYYIGGGYLVFVSENHETQNDVLLINKLALYYRTILGLLLIPTTIFNLIGLFVFDSFQNEVKLKVNPSKAPFICFRFVTRGHYFELIKNNVEVLKNICFKLGMKRFVIQVATETQLPLKEDEYVKQTVIPKDYVTKSGALFKARVLQYCLEDGVNFLRDNDWIVHLDEETKASENSIKGILNFVSDGRYQLGQGMLIFLRENLMTNPLALLDGWRVSDDLGKQRCQLKVFHHLVMEWKGTFFVVQAGAEKNISFDHGPDSSIAEDGYFGFIATKLGYKFNFLEGEMYEMSPTSVWDVIQQRKRWIQGGLIIARSSEIPMRLKFIFCVSMYGILLSFCGVLPVVLRYSFPLPYPTFADLTSSLLFYFSVYYHSFGIIKSFTYFQTKNYMKLFLGVVIGNLMLIPNILLTNFAATLAFISKPKEFYVIKKD